MKTNMRWLVLSAGLLAAPWTGVFNAAARTEVNVEVNINSAHDFYEPLGRYGEWVEVENYGRCWYPAYVASDWRPYADGYWLWTDGGWYWVSDEGWAWATYHYGRWTWDSYYGWIWVPDTQWAPAWVAWREGGGYSGWAPLPPQCGYDSHGYIAVDTVVFAPHWFVFVETRHFCERIRPAIIINQTVVHQTIINKTVNITKVHKSDNFVINNGPNVQVIQNTAQREVPQSTIRKLRRGKPEKVGKSDIVTTGRPPVREVPREFDRTTVVQPWPVKSKASDRDSTLTPPRGVVLGTPQPEIHYQQRHDNRREFEPPVKVSKAGQPPISQVKEGNVASAVPAPLMLPAPDQTDSGKHKKPGKN